MRVQPAAVEQIVRDFQGRGAIAIANYNSPQQVVVSGESTTVDAATAALEAAGARVSALPVSAAFHSPVMESAQQAFTPELEQADLHDAAIPVVSNATGAAAVEAAPIRGALIPQITAPVRWQESIQTMCLMGIDTYIEVGPGKVLSGLIRRCPGAE